MQVKAEELTVNDGTTTNSCVPVYGLYSDYGCRSQFIIPAEDLEDMANSTISGMTFYSSSATLSLTGTWDIYMMEVDESSSTSTFIDRDDATLVWTGSVSVADNEWVIEFEDSYSYGDGNLMIELVETVMGNCPSAAWYGVSGSSVYTKGTSSDHTTYQTAATGTTASFSPKVTFEFTAGGGGTVPCEKPSGITASDITDTQVVLTWGDGSGVYNVEYKKAADTVWTSLLENSTLLTTTLSDLDPNTDYQARVQSACAGNVDNPVSSWKSVNFKTECGFITTFPWSEDFEGMTSNALPDCWDNSASTAYNTSYPYYIWGVFTYSSNKSLRFNNYSAQSGIGCTKSPYIVLPENAAYELSFDYSNTANCDELKVLVSTDGLAWDTLQSLGNTGTSTSYSAPSDWTESIVDLANYAGQTIQIQFSVRGNYGQGAIWIDNLAIYDASCVKPTDLVASEITTNSVDLAWEAEEGQTTWQVEYKKSAESDWIAVEATENPYTLANLEVYTAYDIRVATKCGENISKYSNVVSIKTAAAAPFAEAFTSLPSDWKRYSVLYETIAAGEDTLTNHPVTSGWTVAAGQGVFGTSSHLKLQVYGETVKNWIVSPSIQMNDAAMQLTFDLALTKSSGTLVPAEAGAQDDDKFYVLLTSDGGETWEELYVRDNVTSADPYDNINCSAEGQIVKIDLSDYAGNKIAIAFYGESTETGGSNYLHIRNIDIDTIPSCEKPMGLVVSGVSSSSASFSWDEAEDATWAFGLVANPADDFVPADADFTGTTEEDVVTIDTLSENTPYIFILRRACGGSNSEYIARSFLTEQTPAALPYEDDFENGLNWVLINGDLTNKWVLGEAVHNGEGTHSLYISNDGGTSNAYTNSSAQTVYATKTFNFDEAGIYAVNFDWRAYGESTWDILCVALAPEGTLVEATATAGQWTALPTGWTALHEGTKINLQSAWQHSSYELNIENEGIYKVIMVWRNDGSGGTQPPAAVDNFSIERLLCPTPGELSEVAESATTNSVQLDWVPQGSESNWFIQYKKADAADWTLFDGDVTTPPFTLTGLAASSTYNIRVAAWCDPNDSLSASDWSSAITISTACASISEYPYAENFDAIAGTTSGATSVLPVCWSAINTTTYSSYSGYPNVYNSSSSAASGTNSLRFYSYNYVSSYSSTNYDPQDQYAILPEMENLNTLRMKFNARAYSTSYDADFTVGVMSDPTDTTTFVPVATMEPTTTAYEPFEVRFNTYEGTGKYIAIKMLAAELTSSTGSAYRGVYIDDIVVDPIPDCFEPTAVKVVGATATSVQFTYTAAEEGDSLSYAIVLKGVEPAEFTGITSDTILVEGLEASTEYVLYVRTECANSASASISAAFQTKQLPIDLGNGFADDFEGANQWYFENGAIENAWAHGTAAHNGEGSTKAMYISNDGGASNAYTINKAAVVFAMKAFNIAAGSYTFKYDWIAYGESSSDYIRVALVPASAELTAGTSLPTGVTATALPEGCIALDGGSKLNLSSEWATFTSAELAIPAGTYNVVFMWRNDGSVGTQPPAAIDNFSIAKVLCGKPGTPTIEKANITATTAEIAWTAEEGQTSWQIALDTIAAFNPDTAQLISTNVNPYIAENLLPEHTYYVYVRANCGEDGFSAWSARASFKSAKNCQKPDGLDVTEITDSSAVITWNTYGQSEFRLTYGIGNAYADSVDVIGGTYTITGLTENTSYKVKVAASCDETQWSTAKTFKTACSPIAAVIEDFDGITGSTSSNVLPDCWSYINGGSTYSYLPTAYAGASYANSGTNSLRFYSYASTSYADQYAILPAVNNLNTLRMKLNARKYSASYEGIVVVGIMTDPTDTATFEAIDTVAPASIAYEPFLVSFGEYTGEGLYVALKSPLPVTSSYNGTYIDDIAMEAIPSCLEPTALAVSEIGTDSAKLDWNSTASEWQILLNNDSANLINVTAKPFILNELTPATIYTFAVRAICAEGDTSAWSKSVKFATECNIISLANGDYVQDFESFEGTAYNVAGVTPTCWEVGGTSTYIPHVVDASGSYAWAHSGTKSLNFCGSANSYAYAILPDFAEPISNMQIEFWYRMESATAGSLHLCYVAGDSLTILTTFENATTVTSTGELMLDTVPANAENLAIVWIYSGSSFYSCTIDDITVSMLPTCYKPTGLVISEVKDTIATFAWDNVEDIAWEYAILADAALDSIPADEAFGAIALNTLTVDTLDENTAYVFFLRANCGAEDGKSVIIAKAFHTTTHPAALPFADDFENGNNWLLINDTLTNAWVVGEAVNATLGGSHALYVSKDGGVTNAYDTTAYTMAYAAKLFDFVEAGDYAFQYDWMANGESTYDYMRVALVPSYVQLEASTSVPSSFGASVLPAGWIALDGGSKLNLSTDWATFSDTINVAAGLYNVVFAWRNDGRDGAQAPAAIDNISIAIVEGELSGIEGNAGIENKAVKFIRNNHVYILINGTVYNITGQKVEMK